MLNHYLKIAFRNLRKYRSQTLISVAGLATGFACFAMATLWIRYEMTYDSFHKNADRIYCVNLPDVFSLYGTSRNCPYSLAKYLKATFPEITNAISILSYYPQFELEEVEHNADFLIIDSSFFSMFDVKLVEGSMDFLISGSKNMAITREKAIRLYGNESPLGKKLKAGGDDYTICAVVTGLPKRSNYPFDFLESSGVNILYHTLVEVMPNTDMEAFKKKLYKHEIKKERSAITRLTLTPLTSVRYEDPDILIDVKFQHIIIFAVAGSLLILCTLFNWLTLFVSRFRLRQKEFALRTVFGASGYSLFAMLSVEFTVSLIMALLLGLVFIRLVMSPFQAVSGVRMELSAIYLESAIYIAAIIAVALAAFLLTLAVFRRRSLNANIGGNKKIFRKASIAVQLTVSIVFAFCTAVILKQMYHLHNTDLGFAFKNRGSVRISADYEHIKALADKIKQIPEIEESLSGCRPLLPAYYMLTNQNISEWDGKREDDETIDVKFEIVSEQCAKYYELKMIEGELYNENDSEQDVMINEAAAKAFGWDRAVGKAFVPSRDYYPYRVKGVLKNIYNSSPTVAAKPVMYRRSMIWRDRDGKKSSERESPYILVKYNEGSWKTCTEKIRKIIAEEFPDKFPILTNAKEEYDKFLKSENTLLSILTVISIICIIVCVFGFVSMVSLTCEERRKEIAIRKINGATVKDILDIFFREHLTLLAVGALIAFPAGYLIMKRWLGQYVVQTEMSAWIYVSILLSLLTAIVLCVGEQVYRTSRENPINSIKN